MPEQKRISKIIDTHEPILSDTSKKRVSGREQGERTAMFARHAKQIEELNSTETDPNLYEKMLKHLEMRNKELLAKASKKGKDIPAFQKFMKEGISVYMQHGQEYGTPMTDWVREEIGNYVNGGWDRNSAFRHIYDRFSQEQQDTYRQEQARLEWHSQQTNPHEHPQQSQPFPTYPKVSTFSHPQVFDTYPQSSYRPAQGDYGHPLQTNPYEHPQSSYRPAQGDYGHPQQPIADAPLHFAPDSVPSSPHDIGKDRTITEQTQREPTHRLRPEYTGPQDKEWTTAYYERIVKTITRQDFNTSAYMDTNCSKKLSSLKQLLHNRTSITTMQPNSDKFVQEWNITIENAEEDLKKEMEKILRKVDFYIRNQPWKRSLQANVPPQPPLDHLDRPDPQQWHEPHPHPPLGYPDKLASQPQMDQDSLQEGGEHRTTSTDRQSDQSTFSENALIAEVNLIPKYGERTYSNIRHLSAKGQNLTDRNDAIHLQNQLAILSDFMYKRKKTSNETAQTALNAIRQGYETDYKSDIVKGYCRDIGFSFTQDTDTLPDDPQTRTREAFLKRIKDFPARTKINGETLSAIKKGTKAKSEDRNKEAEELHSDLRTLHNFMQGRASIQQARFAYDHMENEYKNYRYIEKGKNWCEKLDFPFAQKPSGSQAQEQQP
jgi:hypothetical protein